MVKHLSDLKVRQSALVKNVEGKGPLRRRLFDMGITPGTKVTIKKLAPLGDPIEVGLRGYTLSLRKDEGDYVLVETDEL